MPRLINRFRTQLQNNRSLIIQWIWEKWKGYNETQVKQMRAVHAAFIKYLACVVTTTSTNSDQSAKLLEENLPDYFQMDASFKLPKVYNEIKVDLDAASIINYLRFQNGHLRTVTEESVNHICQYQKYRTDHFIKNCPYDPMTLVCEEFKEWLADLSEMQLEKKALDEVTGRIDYLQALQDNKDFYKEEWSEFKPTITKQQILLYLRKTLEKTRDLINLVMDRVNAYKDFDLIDRNNKVIVRKSLEFLFYVLRDKSPLNFMIGAFNQSENSINDFILQIPEYKSVLNTISGKMFKLITLTSEFKKFEPVLASKEELTQDKALIFIGFNNQRSDLIDLKKYFGEKFSFEDWYETDDSGILLEFRKKEYIDHFLKLHAFILQYCVFANICKSVLALAADGGDLIVYGIAVRLTKRILSQYDKLHAYCVESALFLNEVSGKLADRLITNNVSDNSKYLAWTSVSRIKAREAYKELSLYLTENRKLVSKINGYLDNVSIEERFKKIQEDIRALESKINCFDENSKLIEVLLSKSNKITSKDTLQIETQANQNSYSQMQLKMVTASSSSPAILQASRVIVEEISDDNSVQPSASRPIETKSKEQSQKYSAMLYGNAIEFSLLPSPKPPVFGLFDTVNDLMGILIKNSNKEVVAKMIVQEIRECFIKAEINTAMKNSKHYDVVEKNYTTLMTIYENLLTKLDSCFAIPMVIKKQSKFAIYSWCRNQSAYKDLYKEIDSALQGYLDVEQLLDSYCLANISVYLQEQYRGNDRQIDIVRSEYLLAAIGEVLGLHIYIWEEGTHNKLNLHYEYHPENPNAQESLNLLISQDSVNQIKWQNDLEDIDDEIIKERQRTLFCGKIKTGQLKFNIDTVTVQVNQAQEKFRSGQMQEASSILHICLIKLNQLIDETPNKINYYDMRAMVNISLGQHENAVADYTVVINKTSVKSALYRKAYLRRVTAYIDIGKHWLKLKENDKASASLVKATSDIQEILNIKGLDKEILIELERETLKLSKECEELNKEIIGQLDQLKLN